MSTNIQNIKESDLVKSLEKGLLVIQAFSEHTRELTISQAASITGLSKPATRRILLTLTYLGYLHHDEQGKFTLTTKVLSLGYTYFATNQIWSTLTPYLEQLSNTVEESVSIAVLEEDHIVYVNRFATKRIMSMDLNVGAKLPAIATGMGQVLLASLPAEKLNKLLNTLSFTAYTPYTITSIEALEARLEEVRLQKYVLVKEELEIGLYSLAAPLYNAKGQVVAAINISMHSRKLDEKNILENILLPNLLRSAQQISDIIKNVM